MLRTFLFCALAASTGCSFGDDRPLGGDAGPDGQPDGMDGPPMMDKDHLLISEVKSTEDNEFIEIWNPTNRTIDLSNYYLSDVGDYWRLPATPTVVPAANDFVVRFPAGATIAARQVVTVATTGSALTAATYAIDATTGNRQMRDRKVSNPPTITNANMGEVIILFYWDGISDLVKDVDIVIAGTGTTTANGLVAKVPVDGPDPDTIATAYKPENGLLGNGMSRETTVANTSYKRRKLEVGSETQSGDGNGITGDDETSEQLKVTWDGDDVNPLSAPTLGVPPSI